MAMNHCHLVAALVALASCRSSERVAMTTQSECASCVDPEATDDQSYVSIGVMPPRYPIDWGSPNRMYITTIAASVGFVGRSIENPHGVGHVLLKVRCGSDAPFYLSQTGANGSAALQFARLDTSRVNMLFRTYKDGKLYDDDEAEDDWIRSINRQRALGDPPGTYQSDPRRVRDESLRKAEPFATVDIDDLVDEIMALPPVPRHHFVRATIRINDPQCRAIRTWRDAYVASGGPARYALHRAPWVADAAGRYDGGACGSVSFAGAFYATGLDYKAAARRVIERVDVGTGRLTSSIVRDGRRLDGWYLLQGKDYYAPGSVACARNGDACLASNRPWLDPLYEKWSGPVDVAGLHGLAWPVFGAIGGGLGRIVDTRTVPLVGFEPEKFYQEILARWNQPDHDAFGHTGWCKLGGRVPAIVLDGRNASDGQPRAGRAGLRGGFDNAEVNLF
jgi:hypothetical protein